LDRTDPLRPPRLSWRELPDDLALPRAQILRIEGRADEAAPHLERAERFLGTAGDVEERGLLAAEQAQRAASLGRKDEALEHAACAIELLADDARHAATAHHALAAKTFVPRV
jgi:tetratricopeptide (TPR) repeat protein